MISSDANDSFASLFISYALVPKRIYFMDKNNKHFSLSSLLWDLWCIVSVVGIWPRFIEHRLIQTTRLDLPIPSLPLDLNNLKILQFSDLHISHQTSERFLQKFIRKVNRLKPDLILFTGDFICYSNLEQPQRLTKLLCSLEAKYGCFAILGNHDHAQFVSINNQGEYDIINKKETANPLIRGFKKIFTNIKLKQKTTEKARLVGPHVELKKLLVQTPFKLLENENLVVQVGNSFINITGLGDVMAGKFNPRKAFSKYQRNYPGISLVHNPDSAPELKDYPGNLILAGHTHGGQVNLPWLWKRFTLLKNMNFKRGLTKIENKWLYINRGLGCVMKFRWFAIPEILLLTLRRG